MWVQHYLPIARKELFILPLPVWRWGSQGQAGANRTWGLTRQPCVGAEGQRNVLRLKGPYDWLAAPVRVSRAAAASMAVLRTQGAEDSSSSSLCKPSSPRRTTPQAIGPHWLLWCVSEAVPDIFGGRPTPVPRLHVPCKDLHRASPSWPIMSGGRLSVAGHEGLDVGGTVWYGRTAARDGKLRCGRDT